MLEQLDNQLKLKPEESPYWGPIKSFPASIGAADRARLTAEYRKSITGVIYPALQRMRDFLQNEYLAHAREGVGLMYMKGGDALYRYQVQSTTTLPMTPDQIHQLGLSEVARITKDFEKVRQEVGFKGDLHAFFDYMRTSPKFAPKSREQLGRAISIESSSRSKRRSRNISRWCRRPPLVIRPYPTYREKFEAGGSYEQGTPDGSRPGTFYFNAYDLPSRFTWEETTLFLHEGEPGHHFQISLAQENKALPDFMRFGGNTAYVEGWALYAETLGYPMGFYADPYQRFGNAQRRDAARDAAGRRHRHPLQGLDPRPGDRLHAQPLGESKTDATAEVERYIAIPSQATAYKVGALTIQRLRDEGEGGARPQVRHPRIPRPGAQFRRSAAGNPRTEDPRLGGGEKGELTVCRNPLGGVSTRG